jgi:hypothetical protein
VSGQDPGELEATLQAAWDPDTAAVYADLLTSRGDPRGELIALDLALAHRQTPELHDRKRERIATWIGSDKIGDWAWHPRNVRFGLLCGYSVATPTIGDNLALLFATVGDHIGHLGLYGDDDDLAAAVEMIAARRLPWLSSLAIRRPSGTRPIAKAIWQRLVEATPNLRDLTLMSTAIATSPVHPAITTLRLDGAAIAVGKEPIASVTRLDLALVDPHRVRPSNPAAAVGLAPLVNPRVFPALRVLDLSRNERIEYGTPPERVDIVEFLDEVEHLGGLERVRVPSVRDTETAVQLVGILTRHPRLEIDIARMFTTVEGVAHPRLHFPPPRAWPASAHGRDALSVGLPPQQWGDELALSSLIACLEWQFDDMPASAQEAWLALWDFLDDLGWEDDKGNDITKPFPAATLLHALEALDGNGRGDTVARMIREARLPADASINISRYWGW